MKQPIRLSSYKLQKIAVMVCRNKYIDERFHQSGRSNDISQVDRVALLLFGVGSVGDEPTRNDKAHLFGQTHLAFTSIKSKKSVNVDTFKLGKELLVRRPTKDG